MKRYIWFLYYLLPIVAIADDLCSEYYSTSIPVDIVIREHKIDISQPDYSFKYSHGNVLTDIATSYNVGLQVYDVSAGYCIAVESVKMDISYQDFLIQIDKKYKPNSCAYDLVLAHEQSHIDAVTHTVEKYKSDLKRTLLGVATDVRPMFVEKRADIGVAEDKMYDKILGSSSVQQIMQHIKDEIIEKNKKIDSVDNSVELRNCSKLDKKK